MPRRLAGDDNADLSAGVSAEPSDRVKILIEEGDDPKAPPVFISVNGYAYQIKRGIEVVVPRAVINVLNDAVESRIAKIEDGTYVTKSFLRFPYRVVG